MIGGDGINDESNKTAPAPTRNTDLTKNTLTTLPLTGGRLDDPMPIAYALLLAGLLAMGTAIHSRRRHGAHCA